MFITNSKDKSVEIHVAGSSSKAGRGLREPGAWQERVRGRPMQQINKLYQDGSQCWRSGGASL